MAFECIHSNEYVSNGFPELLLMRREKPKVRHQFLVVTNFPRIFVISLNDTTGCITSKAAIIGK